jgi:hypothetical protein
MRLHVFERLVYAMQQVDPYFVHRPNCAGELGLSTLQKVVAVVRILTYSIPVDVVDEYVNIGESTAHEALKHFCTVIQTTFGVNIPGHLIMLISHASSKLESHEASMV